ncbi:MAG: hypothetical protein JSS86_03180 [Cyanobacteria bacterium SZAS LIN-2]|nr:hypothetical protein [Cyanobacteria bacterium SZAS LIN-3]MBS1995281.1 hypothetical protein [Cyanobacteria bacterium SZAS LIN-2]
MTASIGTSAAYISSVTMTEQALTPVAKQSVHSRYLDHGLVLDLIADTSLVDADVLTEALKTASIKEASLIDVLCDGCFIAQSDKRDIMAAYDAVSQGFLYQPWAKQALQSALQQFIPFEDMLLVMGLHPTNAFSECFLAELICTSQLISISQMERARLLCLSRGLTLGQSFVQLGLMNIATYKLLIDGTARYRCGHLSLVQLKEMVASSFAGFNASGQWLKLSQAVRGFATYCASPDLLEALSLLVEAELLTEITVLGVMESALERSVSFDQVAVECSMIEPALVTLATKLAKRVASGEMTSNNACMQLRERCRLLQG